MSRSLRVGVIGAGFMGEGLIRGFLESGLLSRRNLQAAEPRAQRRRELARRYGIRLGQNNAELARSSDVVLLAVKPYEIDAVLQEIAPELSPRKLVVSIAAGIPTRRIEGAIGRKVPVVRVMPNMACTVRQGISGVAGGRHASGRHLKLAGKILSAVGKVVYLDESKLNAVTAVSGSGPAYFFYFIEALRKGAEGLGLSADVARSLVHQTALGSAEFLAASGEEPEVLRARVTSKKGTTEAAIKVLEEKRFKDVVGQALKRAHQRARELAKS